MNHVEQILAAAFVVWTYVLYHVVRRYLYPINWNDKRRKKP